VADPRWISDQAALAELAVTLSGVEVFAFDTEFHRERTYYPHLALMQIAWPDGLALVDPLALDLHPLAPCFDGQALVVAHAAAQDLEVLDRACGAVPSRLFDTQIAAGFLGFSTPSLATLADRILGIHLPKGDRLTDWRQRPLTEGQLTYAAADVAHLLKLATLIQEQLAAASRLEWAVAECDEVYAWLREPQDPDTAWWKIKEVRHLRGKARGVAQEVAAWRERTAAATDRPIRTVLPDLAVLAVSNHPPTTIEGMRGLRGVDGRIPKGQAAAELLAAVKRGAELDPARVRVPPVDDVERTLRPAASLVAAWIGQLARDVRIDATLLATRGDVNSLLRGEQPTRLTSGWRAELIGEPIRRLMSGDAALAFDGRGGLALEVRSGQAVPVEVPLPPVDWTSELTEG
jgi:ribonuclease D